MSTIGAGMFSSILNIISCGKSSGMVLGLRFWPGGEVEVEGQCLVELRLDREGTRIWLVAGPGITVAGIARSSITVVWTIVFGWTTRSAGGKMASIRERSGRLEGNTIEVKDNGSWGRDLQAA